MNNFIWLEEYKIGHALIDQQHEYLFDLANRIVDPGNDQQRTYHNVLGLYHYVREHFKAEEKLMQECAFADYSEHAREHEQLARKLTEVSTGIISGEIQPEDIMVFMRQWLLQHILLKDFQLKALLPMPADSPGGERCEAEAAD